MSSTITSKITTGVTFGYGGITSPLTIAASGYVSNSSGDGLLAPGSYANHPTLVNDGTIEGSSFGVNFNNGGDVDNAGLIQGYIGVRISGNAGTVTNSGTIAGPGGAGGAGSGVILYAGGSITNTGTGRITGSFGVDIEGGGTVTNSATIAGTGGFGVALHGGGTVIDAGRISGGNGTAVSFGGTAGNLLVLQSGYALVGLVVGSTNAGASNTLELGSSASAGTLSAVLQTEFANFGTITVDAGAAWTLTGSNTLGSGLTLSDLGTLTNAGVLDVTAGPRIVDPATLGNSGTISGTLTLSGGSYLDNTGTIAAAGTAVSGAASPNAVTNSGTIGGTSGTGVNLAAGGSVGNTGTGLIQGASGVNISGAAGTVTNSATIAGTSGTGVNLAAGGSVGNTGAGLIQGSSYGVRISGAAGTVTNFATIAGTSGTGVNLPAGGTVIDAGRISGGTGTAVSFGGTGSNLLVLQNGYALGGIIVGSTSAGATNTLELGSAGGAGTLSAAVFNFGTITVDPGAAWTLTGSSVLGSGITLNDFGTLTNSLTNIGTVALSGGSYLGNAGMIAAAGTAVFGATSPNAVVNSGTIAGASGPGVFLIAGGSVSNTGTGRIQGYSGVSISGASGTVSNSATIVGTSGFGVVLDAGGNVANTGTGLIQGPTGVLNNYGTVTNSATIFGGVYIQQGGSVANTGTGLIQGAWGVKIGSALTATTVTNSATIVGTGSGSYGVTFLAVPRSHPAGIVANTGTGLIDASYGVHLKGPSTVINSATIAGTGVHGFGVLLDAGLAGAAPGEAHRVANTGTGLIIGSSYGVHIVGDGFESTVTNFGRIDGTSGIGVFLAAGGTVIDSGRINGGTGTAVSFGGTGGNLLVLQNGYSLRGVVVGSTSAGATNTLELFGSAGAVTVDFNRLSSSGFINFGTAAFGANYGNDDILKISNTAALPGTISGFTQFHDIIDLTQISPNGIQTPTLNGSNQLVVTNGSQTVDLQLDSENYSGVVWQAAPDGSGGTDVELSPCYCRGTRIATPGGEVAVEALAIGDLVSTWSGEARPIKWIGRRSFDGRFVRNKRGVLPICFTAGSLADGAPARDLRMSPEHALYLADVLVPARHLVNGATIVQPLAPERVDYFHIELETHDIIIAEGTPAETYLDCDNRGMYQNAAEFGRLYPDDARPPWQFCAPRLEEMSDELLAIRAVVFGRAAALGCRLDSDPGLHLVADGEIVRPQSVDGRRHRFVLPAGCRAVWLASRVAVPAEIDPALQDRRPLGVSLEKLVLSDATLRIQIAHDFAGLTDGFHADEGCHRWTDGLARLPDELLGAFAGDVTLDVHRIESTLRYRCAPLEHAGAA